MTKKICLIPGCGLPHHGHGWCVMHYWRWRRYGDPVKLSRPVVMVCSIPGCGKPPHAREWCSRHYQRWLRYGDPLGGVLRLTR